jgi:hypothetical protein
MTSIVPAIDGVSFNREDFEMHDSIPKLFDFIEDAICASQQRFAIAREAEGLSVTYHPTFGYPTQIGIDYDQLTADDEISVTIENLQPLP